MSETRPEDEAPDVGPQGEQEDPQEAPEEAQVPQPLPGEGTPEGDRLAQAHAAFERGDYAVVRKLCAPLVEAPQDEVARAARELRARTQVDPVQVGVVLACLVLFGIIAYTYVL